MEISMIFLFDKFANGLFIYTNLIHIYSYIKRHTFFQSKLFMYLLYMCTYVCVCVCRSICLCVFPFISSLLPIYFSYSVPYFILFYCFF